MERPALAARAGPPGRLWLAGYGNRQPDVFFAALAQLDADVALDVRLRPWGWHVDYRGEAFLRALESRAGIGRARWVRRLGNAAKDDGGEMRLADAAAIDDLVAVLERGLDVVVICGCGDGTRCHRALIARLVAERAPQVEAAEVEFPR